MQPSCGSSAHHAEGLGTHLEEVAAAAAAAAAGGRRGRRVGRGRGAAAAAAAATWSYPMVVDERVVRGRVDPWGRSNVTSEFRCTCSAPHDQLSISPITPT